MYDLEEIRSKVSLVALAEAAGAHFQNPNQLSSCCPLPHHAGDRNNPAAFHIYEAGRKWKCFTSCPEGANGGDLFAFYMAWKEVDFKTAVRELAEQAQARPLETAAAPSASPTASFAPAPPGPSLAWQARAGQFIAWAQHNLSTDEGAGARAYLEQVRGLWPETWQAFRLGYNPRNLVDDPARWGLAGKKIWLPRGIIIPGIWRGQPWYIKIRRPIINDALGDYIGNWTASDGLPEVKFGGPRGGQAVLFGQDQTHRMPVLLLVEGEWDAMLTWQWCQDLCDVSTLGGAQTHLDLLDLAALARYPAVIVVHDDDQAGEKGRQYIARMREITPRIRSADPPAHDLTDFWKAGGNLRAWVAGHVADALEETLRQVDRAAGGYTVQRWEQIAGWARVEAQGSDTIPAAGREEVIYEQADR